MHQPRRATVPTQTQPPSPAGCGCCVIGRHRKARQICLLTRRVAACWRGLLDCCCLHGRAPIKVGAHNRQAATFRDPFDIASYRIAVRRISDARLNPVRASCSFVLHLGRRDVSHGVARPSAVGWDKNSGGKLGPRLMDLSKQMKPETLAEASVDLNLRLMRWRLMPGMQTERVAPSSSLPLPPPPPCHANTCS